MQKLWRKARDRTRREALALAGGFGIAPFLFPTTAAAQTGTVSGSCGCEGALSPTNLTGDTMPTQLKLFSANGSETFSALEKEVNDWLAARGDSIQPVNSQTATCAIASSGDQKQSQAVIIALWYLDPPHHH